MADPFTHLSNLSVMFSSRLVDLQAGEIIEILGNKLTRCNRQIPVETCLRL